MRILWIEDNPYINAETEQLWFGDFYQSQEIERLRDFSHAYQAVSQALRRYDLVVLDINLEYSAPVKTPEFAEKLVFPEERPFLEEAGFHLYLKLLKQGFPQPRVIFLTSNTSQVDNSRTALVEKFDTASQEANQEQLEKMIGEIRQAMSPIQSQEFIRQLKTGLTSVLAWLKQWCQQEEVTEVKGETTKNTFEEFKKRFHEARLIPPKVIDKKRDCPIRLQNWLQSHCTRTQDHRPDYDYLTLRRGISNVITALQQNPKVSLTKDFRELDKQTFLKGLEWQLRDLVLPREDYHNVYLALCDYLTKPYERYDGKELLQDSSRHLKLPLYHLRNWIAHGLILGSQTQLSAQIAGATFLMAMQSLFEVTHYGFQNELKRLFSPKPVTTTDLRTQIKSLLSDYDRKDPLKALHKRGQKENPKWTQENYLRHFYAAYLFSIQQSEDYSIRGDTDAELNAIVYYELKEVSKK